MGDGETKEQLKSQALALTTENKLLKLQIASMSKRFFDLRFTEYYKKTETIVALDSKSNQNFSFAPEDHGENYLFDIGGFVNSYVLDTEQMNDVKAQLGLE